MASFRIAGQQITHILNILVNIVFPTIEQTFHAMQQGVRQPYHTSILSGEAWVQEPLYGHPRHIQTELGVHLHVFRELVFTLRHMGHQDSKYVTLEEQLAIFLYTCVTGLTSTHADERFQHTGKTISRFVEFTLNMQLLNFLFAQVLSEDGQYILLTSILHQLCPPLYSYPSTIYLK